MIAKLLADHTFLIYLYTFLALLYSAVFFSLIWKKFGKASTVYIYINLLFWAIAINLGMLTITRIVLFVNIGLRDKILMNWFWWPLRMYPMAIIITAIGIHMTYRYKTGKAGEHPFGIPWKVINDTIKRIFIKNNKAK